MPTTGRPNILFLMSDEHRADVAGFAGNRVVRTPTLDWLAQTGVVFANAYTPSPICIPARQCMAAGQLPRTCGVECYGQDLPPSSMTFARWFTEFAYGTVCCGKLHHDGPDQMQGWQRRIGSNCRLSDEYTGVRPEEADRYRPVGQDGKWSDAKEVIRAGVGFGENTHVPDELALLGALRLIEARFVAPYYDRPQDHRPTLLKVSFNRPHYPYFTTADRFEYYLPRVKPYVEEAVFDHPFLSTRQVRPGHDASVRELTRATAAYYGMIDEIDTDYGKVLEALRRAGQDLDDWIIIYVSDHGEMLGEHGVWEKQKFFEGSARVPLIIRWPQRFAPRVVSENVNLCDLFATLCDLAGLPLPPADRTVNGAGLDSRSLVGLMEGNVSAGNGWDDETVSQFGASNLMIKQGSLKYHFYARPDCAAAPEVLTDLSRDAAERANFINLPEYAPAVERFRRRRDELGFGPAGKAGYRNAGYAASL